MNFCIPIATGHISFIKLSALKSLTEQPALIIQLLSQPAHIVTWKSRNNLAFSSHLFARVLEREPRLQVMREIQTNVIKKIFMNFKVLA